MKVPTMMRLDQELIDQIEAYRVRAGIKSTAEATRRLVSAGLAAEGRPSVVTMHVDAEVGRNMTRPTGRSVTGGLHSPLDTTGQPIKRQAKPKTQKEKR